MFWCRFGDVEKIRNNQWKSQGSSCYVYIIINSKRGGIQSCTTCKALMCKIAIFPLSILTRQYYASIATFTSSVVVSLTSFPHHLTPQNNQINYLAGNFLVPIFHSLLHSWTYLTQKIANHTPAIHYFKHNNNNNKKKLY